MIILCYKHTGSYLLKMKFLIVLSTFVAILPITLSIPVPGGEAKPDEDYPISVAYRRDAEPEEDYPISVAY